MIKDEVLKIIKSSPDYVSGQKICELLNVSRTAVWKAINTLKEEGYKIESSTNKGYKLNYGFDILNSIEIIEKLKEYEIDLELIYKDSIDSTNSLAKRSAADLKKDALFVAGEQTSGRGRRSRAWNSPKDTGIWMSLLLHPTIETHKASMLTLLVALAIERVMQGLGLNTGIKWPNDIVINKKKLCGILTEMSADMDGIKYIVCGIGINVNNKDFGAELKNLATSMYLETHKEYSRKDIIAKIIKEFYEIYSEFLLQGDLSFVIEEYNKFLLGNGEYIKVIDLKNSYEARQLGINEKGELVVEKEDKTKLELISGEISIRGLYTYE